MSEKLVWLDIETTGLRPAKDAILEIGVAVTDLDLKLLDEQSWIIKPSMAVHIGEIDPIVISMHETSGLWKECLLSQVTLEDAAYGLRIWFSKNGLNGQKPIACGSSVHFDRGFLRVQAPPIDDLFHYRNLDVSTLREYARIYRPEKVFERPTMVVHRVLADIHGSIAEFAHYRKTLGWML